MMYYDQLYQRRFESQTNIPQTKFSSFISSRILSVRGINAWEVESFCQNRIADHI